MRIIFMGTPDFAVPCLERILADGHEVCGVFTQTDKPKGRGYVLTPPPVKELALRHGIPVFQPKTLKDDGVVGNIRSLSPELIVVVAYGRLLPEAVLSIPLLGCVNVHASLLPKYRGAAPIQWSVVNGEAVTGVTTMFMSKGLDTGDIILKRETPIGPDETAGALYDRLMVLGADALSETIGLLMNGSVPREKQEDAFSTYAPILKKSDGQIDFSKSAREIHNLVRGLCPWPVAYTSIGGKMLKVFAADAAPGEVSDEPGRVIEADENGIRVACGGDDAVILTEVQGQGGKRMKAADYLRGHPVAPGEQCV